MENRKVRSSPILYVKGKGEKTTNLELKITNVPHKIIVRFTGGCGYMSAQDAFGLYQRFIDAFQGFSGAILFGGTRMLRYKKSLFARSRSRHDILLGVFPKDADLKGTQQDLTIAATEKLKVFDTAHDECLVMRQSVDPETKRKSLEDNEVLDEVVPGITEIPPLIRAECDECVILGIVPKSQDMRLTENGIVVVSENDYCTIIHPDQDECLVVQQSADDPVSWEAEFEECIRITSALRTYAGFSSLLVSYNGGSITEKEILATAKLGWPILLVNGSGRKTEEYANNSDFLKEHPSVMVTNKTHLRSALIKAGAIKEHYAVGLRSKTA